MQSNIAGIVCPMCKRLHRFTAGAIKCPCGMMFDYTLLKWKFQGDK